MRSEESWQAICVTLGFPDEASMLAALYETMSIAEIAKKLGYSKGIVERRIARAGIKKRPRGGPNRHVTSELHGIPDEEFADVHALASKLGLHYSTVYKEARRRGLCISVLLHQQQSLNATQEEATTSSVSHSLPDTLTPPRELTLSGIEEELLREMSSFSTTEPTSGPATTPKSICDSPESCDQQS